MKVAWINGSPKAENSASGSLLNDLSCYVSDRVEIFEAAFHNTYVPEETVEELGRAQAWVVAFPLYVDGIPAHVLSCLVQLENVPWRERQIHIYGIVNCGFYEGIQAESALKILENWCRKTGFIWGGGLGIGGGGALAQMPQTKNGHGPKAPVDAALQSLADDILSCRTHKNQFVSIAFPRPLYQLAAQIGWRLTIRANGGKIKDLGKRWE